MDKFASLRFGPPAFPGDPGLSWKHAPEDVERLIDVARNHPLGLDFLRAGALDSVAATFGVHAFLIESARDRLR